MSGGHRPKGGRRGPQRQAFHPRCDALRYLPGGDLAGRKRGREWGGAMHVVVGVAINIYALREELTLLSLACLAAYTELSPLLHTILYFR